MNRCKTLLICGLIVVALPGVAKSGPGATVNYGGQSHGLRIFGICGAGSDGGYNIWAVTPDEAEPSVAKEGAARLHAASNGASSVLEFYPEGSDTPLVVRGQGESLLRFDADALNYDGPADGGEGTIAIHLQC